MSEAAPINLTIEVLYTCNACGLRKIAVPVPARGAEDVVEWVRNVMTPSLVADHRRRSFLCRPQTLSEVWIPANGERVGELPRN